MRPLPCGSHLKSGNRDSPSGLSSRRQRLAERPAWRRHQRCLGTLRSTGSRRPEPSSAIADGGLPPRYDGDTRPAVIRHIAISIITIAGMSCSSRVAGVIDCKPRPSGLRTGLSVAAAAAIASPHIGSSRGRSPRPTLHYPSLLLCSGRNETLIWVRRSARRFAANFVPRKIACVTRGAFS